MNPPEPKAMLTIEKQAAVTAAANATNTSILPRWMKVATASEYSAIGRSTLYQLLNEGKIKSHRIGGSRLLDRESIDAFIEGQPAVKTA